MRAFITSIGETTTDLCEWSLKRQGFDVVVIKDRSSLWTKLAMIFDVADGDFVRVDADVIVNKNIKELISLKEAWWYQSLTYDWHKQDSTHGGIQFIKREAFYAVREHINEAERMERPESYLCRLEEFHNPRRFETFDKICGLNGYAQSDINRIKEVKYRRNQQENYDFELAERINQL